MKRRRLLALLGFAVGGGSISVGSGAFSSTKAERTVDIAVADDEDAYLGLNDTSDWGRTYSAGDPEEISFSIPGVQEDTPGDTLGNGVGPDSKYSFSNLMEITNRGDDTVTVWSKPGNLAPGIDFLSLVNNSNNAEVIDKKANGVVLAPGEMFTAGLFVDTGPDLGTFNATLTIMAEQESATGSIDGGTSNRFSTQNAATTGPTSGDNSGVRFDFVNHHEQTATITDVSVTSRDGHVDLVSDRRGGTNYEAFSFNADVHIEAMQDGYIDAGSQRFRLPTTLDFDSDGFADYADREARLAPGEVATVNLYSFRDTNGNKLNMAGHRLDLTFSVKLEDGTTDRISASVTP